MIAKKESQQDHSMHSLNASRCPPPNANLSTNLFERKRTYSEVLLENHLLKIVNKRLSGKCDLLEKRVKELEETVRNCPKSQSLSTPSSKVYPKSNRSPKGSRPRGAPKGHRGASLKIPEQVDDEFIHSPEICPFCGCTELGDETKGWSQTVFDIQPIPLKVIRHVNKRRWCPHCKKKVSKPTSDTLPHRNYGPNITTMVGHFETLGIPLPKIQLIIKSFFGHKISIPALMDLANLFGKSIDPEYQNLLGEARNASPVYADETSFRVNGINNWCWDFVWPNGILYVIDPSRGKKVPLEVLGEDFQGLLAHDGWRAYNSVGGRHQTCYIHVNRMIATVEVKRRVEDRGFLEPTPVRFKKKGRPPKLLKEFLEFADQLRTIMRDAVKFSEQEPSPSHEERFQMHDKLLQRIDNLISMQLNDGDAVRIQKFVRGNRDRFFTFVTYPEIRWENNTAERGVRTIANIRNNSGGRRSREGADTLQALVSVFETWRIRGLDVFEEGKNALVREIWRSSDAVA